MIWSHGEGSFGRGVQVGVDEPVVRPVAPCGVTASGMWPGTSARPWRSRSSARQVHDRAVRTARRRGRRRTCGSGKTRATSGTWKISVLIGRPQAFHHHQARVAPPGATVVLDAKGMPCAGPATTRSRVGGSDAAVGREAERLLPPPGSRNGATGRSPRTHFSGDAERSTERKPTTTRPCGRASSSITAVRYGAWRAGRSSCGRSPSRWAEMIVPTTACRRRRRAVWRSSCARAPLLPGSQRRSSMACAPRKTTSFAIGVLHRSEGDRVGLRTGTLMPSITTHENGLRCWAATTPDHWPARTRSPHITVADRPPRQRLHDSTHSIAASGTRAGGARRSAAWSDSR